jgi:RNA polymerase sigma factor (sigma-70 family)
MEQATPTPLPIVTAQSAFAFADTLHLTTRLRARDEAAFAWLHREWGARLNRYCFALAAGDEAFAREIAQATWLRLVRHVKPVKEEQALWNWIACAARHAATDLRRTSSRYRQVLDRFLDWWKTCEPSPAEIPDTETALHHALEKALQTLTAEEGMLIEGRYFQNESLEAIGERCGLSGRAVEGRLARLRQRLREQIADELRSL